MSLEAYARSLAARFHPESIEWHYRVIAVRIRGEDPDSNT